MTSLFSYALAVIISVGPAQLQNNPDSGLVNNIAWSIGHEGCSVYQTDPHTGRLDLLLPATTLRKCFRDSQRDNQAVVHLIDATADSELLEATKNAIQVAKTKFSAKENLGWVLFHEGQLEYFRSLVQTGNFVAIRNRYRQLQGHNADAVNALSSLTDSELDSTINPERLSVFIKAGGDNAPDPSTLAKIASFTEPTVTTLRSAISLESLAKQTYGTSDQAYLAVLESSNPDVLSANSDRTANLPFGMKLTIPSLPVPGRVESLPLRSGVSASTASNSIAASGTTSVKSEVPKRGQIEKPAVASLQSTTVANVAFDGQQWFLSSISADQVKRGDLGFLSPPVVAVVGVVDAGINKNHPLITPVLWPLPEDLKSSNWPSGSIGYDFFLDTSDPIEQVDDSHGTHVTGIVTGRQLAAWLPFFDDAGLSTNVEAFCLKVAGPDGTFDFTNAQNAIEAAITKGIHIFNLSLSGPKSNNLNEDLSREERINNTLFIVAAGNVPDGTPRINLDTAIGQLATFRYKNGAGLENFIFVAALTDKDELADFSNYGKPFVQIAAPGVEISSTITPDTFGTLSGTSQAAPFVSLTAAILKAEKPDMVPMALKHRILNTCDWDEKLKDVVENGCRLNLAKAIVCNSDLVELMGRRYLRGDIDRAQFFPGTGVNTSLVRVWVENSNSAVYVYTSGMREPKSLAHIKSVNLKLHEGEQCPNPVVSAVCTINLSQVKDIVFRLR